jgi:hypothetical protein
VEGMDGIALALYVEEDTLEGGGAGAPVFDLDTMDCWHVPGIGEPPTPRPFLPCAWSCFHRTCRTAAQLLGLAVHALLCCTRCAAVHHPPCDCLATTPADPLPDTTCVAATP